MTAEHRPAELGSGSCACGEPLPCSHALHGRLVAAFDKQIDGTQGSANPNRLADLAMAVIMPTAAKPTRSGVAEMYAEWRAAEFERLRDLMAEAITEDAARPRNERVGIVNAILGIRQLQRAFEERDRLRANAHYWIDYACAYAGDQERAEAAIGRVRARHQPMQHMGKTWCGECSVRRSMGPKTEEWVAFIPHPCPTIRALDGSP